MTINEKIVTLSTNRNEVFVRALNEVNQRRLQRPGFVTLWKSLVDQLEFLIQHKTYSKCDAADLKKICIGHMAIKNIEDWDEPLARILLAVQSDVDAIYKELTG